MWPNTRRTPSYFCTPGERSCSMDGRIATIDVRILMSSTMCTRLVTDLTTNTGRLTLSSGRCGCTQEDRIRKRAMYSRHAKYRSYDRGHVEGSNARQHVHDNSPRCQARQERVWVAEPSRLPARTATAYSVSARWVALKADAECRLKKRACRYEMREARARSVNDATRQPGV